MRGSRCQRQKCHIINISIDCSTTTKNNIDNSISALKYSHWMCWMIKTPFYSRTRSSSWTSDWKSQTPGPSTPRWTSPSFTSGKSIWIYCIYISVCICIDEVDVGKITKTTRLNPTRLIGSVFQDWRAGGRDHSGEVEDQCGLWPVGRHLQRDAQQILDFGNRRWSRLRRLWCTKHELITIQNLRFNSFNQI